MSYAFVVIVFATLTLAGFLSLRWTKLDPQYPKPSATWWVWATSATAAALVVFSNPNAPFAALTASVAVGMITKTAIVPPVKITAEETPNFLQRSWQKGTSAALGGLLQALLLGLGMLIFSWLPFFDDLPVWFGCYAFACALSIWTRPISQAVDPHRINRFTVTDVDMSPEMVSKRLLALASLLVWLLVAFPTIQNTFDPDTDHLAVLAAVFGGSMLVDLT